MTSLLYNYSTHMETQPLFVTKQTPILPFDLRLDLAQLQKNHDPQAPEVLERRSGLKEIKRVINNLLNVPLHDYIGQIPHMSIVTKSEDMLTTRRIIDNGIPIEDVTRTDCYMWAFQRNDHSDYDATISDVLANWKRVTNTPRALAIYTDDDGNAIHFGRVAEDGRIISKLGYIFDLIKHPPFWLPDDYGTQIYYFLEPNE